MKISLLCEIIQVFKRKAQYGNSKNTKEEKNWKMKKKEMKKCKGCGAEIRAYEKVCPKCFKKQNAIPEKFIKISLIFFVLCMLGLIISSLSIHDSIIFALELILLALIFIGMPVSLIWIIVNFIMRKEIEKPKKILKKSIAFSFYLFVVICLAISDETDIEYGEPGESVSVSETNDKKDNKDADKDEKEHGLEDGKNDTEKDSEKETQKDEQTRVEDVDEFIGELNMYLDEDMSNKLNDILKTKIGFKKMKFVEKMGGTFNYSIEADGYDLVVTDLEDDFRIFIPSSSYVFYEDGKVLLTVDELNAKKIDKNDRNAYYIIAKEIIMSCLKNPNSADFPSIVTNSQDIAMQKDGDIVAVQSYVDAQNSFGTNVRSEWVVQFKVIDLDLYSYELVYLNIDGEISGEFINMD